MQTAAVIPGPDVHHGPLALFSGTFEERLAKAAAAGYDGVELMVRDPATLDWPALKDCLQSYHLAVPQLVTGELFGEDGLCIVTPDDDLHRCTLQRLQAVIDLAKYLEAMVNIGRVRGRLDSLGQAPAPLSIAIERFAPLADYAAGQGVRLALEPLNRYESDFINTVDGGLAFIAGLGSASLGAASVGLMLDLFHMNIEEASIEAALLRAKDRLWHVHIADSNRRYPGSGHLDFPPVFDTLRRMNYRGWISAEMLPLPDPDTAALKTIEFLRARQ